MLLIFFIFVFMTKFNNRNRTERPASIINHVLHCSVIYTAFRLQVLLVNLSGNFEKNTGTNCYLAHSLIKCNWNLNSIITSNFIKVNLSNIKYFRPQHKYNMPSESYLYSFISSDIVNLHIPDYSCFRFEHPSNKKSMAFLIYYKSALPKSKIETIFLPEFTSVKLKPARKIWRFLSFYRTLAQIQVELEEFSEIVYSILDYVAQNNPFKVIVEVIQCQVKKNGILMTLSFEDSKIDFLTSTFDLHQIINQPKHVMKTSSPTIDLMFTSQPNLVTESDIHSLLHENCHHQIALDIAVKCSIRPAL